METSNRPPSPNPQDITPAREAGSSTSFKFPIPSTSGDINTWLQHIPSRIMAGSESENSLVESAYEFIDTDGESRDDHDDATDSVASIDFGGRPGDVASLADDTDQSEDESTREEDNRSGMHTEVSFEISQIATLGKSNPFIVIH